jgi:hypothetical protein
LAQQNGFGPAFSSTRGYYEAGKQAQQILIRVSQAVVLSIYGPTNENQMKKNQNMLVWLNKMVFAQHFRVQDYQGW